MCERIDARGKQCPIPLIEARKALEKMGGGTLEISVDNFIAVQNLLKMAEQKKWEAGFEEIDANHYVVRISEDGSRTTGGTDSGGRTSAAEETDPMSRVSASDGTDSMNRTNAASGHMVIALTSDQMGTGDEKLGRILMKGFIYALTELDALPEIILLYNSGAKLSVEGSDSLADLKLLESRGVKIRTCGTCLNHYGLTEKLAAGTVTNMYAITEELMQAGKVVRP